MNSSLWLGSEREERTHAPEHTPTFLAQALGAGVELVGCRAGPGAGHCLANEVFKCCLPDPGPWGPAISLPSCRGMGSGGYILNAGAASIAGHSIQGGLLIIPK